MKLLWILNLIKRGLNLLLPVVILFFVAKLAVSGIGVVFTVKDVFAFMMAIFLLSFFKKTFWYIAFPAIIFYALYYPVGKNFGPPSFRYIASIFATDSNEIKEFLKQIPVKDFIYSSYILLGSIIFRMLTKHYFFDYIQNKIWLKRGVALGVFILLLGAPYLGFITGPKMFYESSKEVYEEHQKLKNLSKISHWAISKSTPHYQNYVLIIGESARKDYHHVYGYPMKNTPFLSSTKGVFVDGMTSSGSNTIASLRLMLTKSDKAKKEADYQMNLVDLANAAQFHTVWISNQGYLGKHDTPVSVIANKSKESIFIKKTDYGSKNTDDELLLPFFQKMLEEKVTSHKLIVLHLYGSHSYACDRLHHFKNKYLPKNPIYKDISCYVASIEKTDNFLKQVNQILEKQYKEKNESYSMIYFADHGLTHQNIGGKVVINNSSETKEHFNIPLVKISSDDVDRKFISVEKSGLNFTEGIGHWLGIESKQLDDNTDLFDNHPHKMYGFDELKKSLPSSPAINFDYYH